MPTLLGDIRPHDLGSRDPQRSGDAGPIYTAPGRGEAADVEAVSEYARKLWSVLDQVARYLAEQVARGSMLTTDAQWQDWRAAYATVLSTLAGPAGDEGYGEQEAQLEYQNGFSLRADS
jgi:hypothetical protein